MATVDIEKLRRLAESAEKRAQEHHLRYQNKADMARTARSRRLIADAVGYEKLAAGLLNDFFYWSGKATAYRGIIAMIELQAIVDEEVDAEPSCP